MIRRHGARLRVALMVVDLVGAALLFAIVAILRVGPDAWTAALGVSDGSPWLLALAYGSVWVSILWVRGLYRLRARWSIRREATDIVTSAILFAGAVLCFLYVARIVDVSRLFLLLLFPAQAVTTLAERVILRRIFEEARRRGANARFVLIVGAGPAAQGFADCIEGHPGLGLRVIGHLATGSEPAVTSRPMLGDVDAIEAVLHGRVVDEVAICLPLEAWALAEPISRICEAEGKVVRIPLAGVGVPLERGILEEFDGQPIVSFIHGPDQALSLAAKRGLDLVLASVALVLLSPVVAIIALRIRLVDGSPVIFCQSRVGLHGRTFRLLKFRTMVRDAEERRSELAERNEVRGEAFKLTDDPRLTHTGRFLRRTSLDEIPQLWNVLRGEMSLVGPRPPLPDEVRAYDIWHRRRLSMKPGMTGLWQVEGRREPVFDHWVRMDLDYIDRWSLWLDLVIMLRTVPAVLGLHGR